MIEAETWEWVSGVMAIVGAAAAVAALWGVFRRFRLEFRPLIDERREAIKLDVKNRGRASGWIKQVAVIDAEQVEIEAAFAGLPDERFKAVELPGHTSWSLIMRANPETGSFPDETRLLAVWVGAWGRDKRRELTPKTVHGRAYYPLASEWPTVTQSSGSAR